MQKGQTALIDKLIACCKEVRPRHVSVRLWLTRCLQPNAERTQRLFASLREELERRGTMPMGNADGTVSG